MIADGCSSRVDPANRKCYPFFAMLKMTSVKIDSRETKIEELFRFLPPLVKAALYQSDLTDLSRQRSNGLLFIFLSVAKIAKVSDLAELSIRDVESRASAMLGKPQAEFLFEWLLELRWALLEILQSGKNLSELRNYFPEPSVAHRKQTFSFPRKNSSIVLE